MLSKLGQVPKAIEVQLEALEMGRKLYDERSPKLLPIF
jgi:hypothetical protein